MAQRIEPVEPTRQRNVLPGDRTGIYYIPLCNELKDFTRTVCDVDRVQVFRTSTSGWVRVRGRHNFDKAWRLLNGGHFNGRCIIASDRNRSETIKIKELDDGHPAPASEGGVSSTIPYDALAPPVHGSVVSYGQGLYTDGYPHPNAVAVSGYSASDAELLVEGGSLACSADDYSQDDYGSPQTAGTAGSFWEAQLPYQGSPEWLYGDMTNTEPPPGDGTSFEYHQTKRRKVLIRDLPFQAKPDQVDAWIHKKSGSYSSKISSIKVPQSRSSAELRGHAYVVFRSSSAAKEAVKLLDQGTFKGRQISARMAVEGVRIRDEHLESQSGGQHEYGDAIVAVRGKEWEEPHRSTRHKETTSSPVSRKTAPPEKESDGASGNSGKSEKRKDKKHSGPVVVVGTQEKHRHKKR